MSGRLRFGHAAFVTSLVFGLGHGVNDYLGGFHVDIAPILETGMTGGSLALCRTRSRSLVWPIVCHSAINPPIFAIAMIRA
jgi:membrane protease YdiL (CAAX protease family)